MKKLLLISTLVTSLAGLSAFGQGYFNFSGNKSSVWDGTGFSDVRNSTINVAFLWGPSGDTPTVSAILAGVPNTMNAGNCTYDAGEAWYDILHDPNFTLGLDYNTGNSLAVQQTITSGAWQFVGQPSFHLNSFGVTGTSSATTYSIFAIGWSSVYATPTDAAAAGSYVGWSPVLQYTFLSQVGAATTPLWTPFAVTEAPEPSTMALAGLGGLSILLFRRRK